MKSLSALALVCAAGALAQQSDPPGTVPLTLEVGAVAPLKAQPGANLICDDLTVVAAEFTDDGFAVRALKPGTTLCGLWIGDKQPGGLYRVVVVKPPPPPDAGVRTDGGASNDGGR